MFENILSSKSFLPITKNNNTTIVLSHNCNFNCWYCYDKKNRENPINKNIFLDIEKIKAFLENYKLLVGNSLSLNLLGGEPTLHPQFKEILEMLNRYSFIKQVTITTNGSDDIENYKTYFSILKEKLIISISIHNNYKKYFSLLTELKGMNVNISYMLDSKLSFEDIKKGYVELQTFGFNIVLVPLHFTEYSEDIKNLININHSNKKLIKLSYKDGSSKVILSNVLTTIDFNPFKGMKCDSLFMNWSVTPFGKICSDCTLDKNNTSMYNCFDGSFKTFIENCKSETCQLNSCHCFTMHRKYR